MNPTMQLQFVIRDFTTWEAAGEIAAKLCAEIPHVNFDCTYVMLVRIHQKDGQTVVQNNCVHQHPWGQCGIRVNFPLSRAAITALITRAERCGWDVVLDGVRLSEHPTMVWRKLATWVQFPTW